MKELPDEKELAELLEIAKITEQKAKELCDLAAAIDKKCEKRLEQFRQAAAQKQS